MPGTSTEHVPYVEEFKCTSEFQQQAKFFLNNGCYTTLPKESQDYVDFWKEEHRRCMEGMTNSIGITITGVHYFYLNYVQIRSEDKKTKRKAYQFPRFLSIDYDYFHLIEVCRRLGKDLILTKPRRTGFTLKTATLIAHEYNFYRGSVCVVGAYLDRLSTTTMNAVLENMNFLNIHTEWKKSRNPDTKEIVKARYQQNLDGTVVWRGYMSEVRKITFKDNEFAAVGLSTNIFLFEEAGTHDNLVGSFNLTKPCWLDGENRTGLAVVQGTGGDMTARTQDFADMFYNPDQYGFLSFQNIWEQGKENTRCGWFIPAMRGKLGEYKDELKRLPQHFNKPMIDEEGNDIEWLADEAIEDQRTIARMGSNPQVIQDAITQYPRTPAESFLRSSGAIFSSIEMHEWLSKLETIPELRDNKKKIELYFDDNGIIKAKLNPDLIDIINYPLDRKASQNEKRGCIVVWEDPIDTPPFGLYIAGCDPYDQDKADTSESLGSFFIYKRFIHAGQTYDTIVAEFTGRPERADDFYETCRKLCIYYNARCLYENQLKGLKGYFEMKNSLHYLCEQPQIIKDIVKDSKVTRGYGIHMNRGSGGATGIKDQCEIYVRQWLYEERDDINGDKIMNLHTIKSIPLLKELIAYDRDANTDRVIAFMLCILQSKEMHKIHIESTSPKTLLEMDTFFSKKYFQKNVHNKIRY